MSDLLDELIGPGTAARGGGRLTGIPCRGPFEERFRRRQRGEKRLHLGLQLGVAVALPVEERFAGLRNKLLGGVKEPPHVGPALRCHAAESSR